MDAKESVEVGIGSLGKIRIIKALSEESKLATIYLLHKKTRLKRDDIKNNLDDLVRIGWVRQNKYASVMYGINFDNKFVALFIGYLKEVGYLGQQE